MMDLWNSLRGMVEAELTSADPDGLLRAAGEAGIGLYRVDRLGELTLGVTLSRKDLPGIKALAEKRGEEIKVVSRRGLFWLLRSAARRPVLALGCAAVLAMVLFLPTRVLFVRVEGNGAVPDAQIMEAAEAAGIRFWASRRQVRSEKVKNALLEALPRLRWAGVNTSGCTAVISVREKEAEKEKTEEAGVSCVAAAVDGVVTACTATRGTLLCAPGDTVRAGQVLISGYTDCGICLRAGEAQGEVYARTIRPIRAICPGKLARRGHETRSEKKYSLIFGKNRINLWKGSGIWEGSCGRMYEEYYITLPGGFALPFGMAVETVTWYEPGGFVPPEDPEALLREFARVYLGDTMVAGAVLSENTEFSREEDVCRLEGNFLCTEMIGRVQREQIGEYYGKNS